MFYANKSSHKIYQMFCNYRRQKISLVWTWRGSSLKWVYERDATTIPGESMMFLNHSPTENDALTSEKAQAAQFSESS